MIPRTTIWTQTKQIIKCLILISHSVPSSLLPVSSHVSILTRLLQDNIVGGVEHLCPMPRQSCIFPACLIFACVELEKWSQCSRIDTCQWMVRRAVLRKVVSITAVVRFISSFNGQSTNFQFCNGSRDITSSRCSSLLLHTQSIVTKSFADSFTSQPQVLPYVTSRELKTH